MNKGLFARRLLQGTSLSIIVSAASLLTCAPAYAQDDTANSAPKAATDTKSDSKADDIVVTGTRIRGVAPVGSSVIQLDQAAMTKTGVLSTADILAKVPAVLTLGSGNTYSGGSSQNADLNALGFNKSPNLRGFGPQATLSLVNGHRVPYDGANMNTFDGDNIPVQMLQRIDIVADGTSAIFGADAVTGTVNYVMRAPFTGAEAYAEFGHADGQNTYQITGISGYDWGSGGIVISYQHAYSDRLKASSRPNLYNDDFTAEGGPGSSVFSSPGNIVYNGNTYALPTGQDGTNLTLAQIGAAGTANTQNVWTGYDAIPQFTRDEFAMNFKQQLGDHIEIYADGFYSNRDFDINLYSNAVNNRSTVVVPNSNYYSPCNHSLVGASADLLAACATGSLTVDYNNVNDAGAADRSGFTRTWSATIGTKIDLFGDWKANAYASMGKNVGQTVNTLYFGNNLNAPFGPPSADQAALIAALASNTSSAFNPFCDGSSLNCGNGQYASNIVGPAGYPAGNSLDTNTTFENQDYSVVADGSLFTLPGGNVRLAIGGEHQDLKFINANNFATTVDTRHINSAFGELYVPLVGSGNAMPGIEKLELTGAIRLDRYSDVGQTVNPKIGLNWSPTNWLKLRGSYGTSFRAPGLVDNDPNSQAGYLPNYFPGSVIDSSLCPTCASNPNAAIYQALGGAAGNLKPETSTSWSLGFEIAPPSSGFNASVTYWNINYTNQVSFPVYSVGAYQAINQGYYDSQIIYNPTYFPGKAAGNPVALFGPYPADPSNASCAAVIGQAVTTQALFNDMINCINAGATAPVLGAGTTPNNVLALNNGHRINAGSTHGQGFDISASYDWHTGENDWHLGVIGAYTLKWLVAPIAGAPTIDQVNTLNNPLRFRGRAEAGWSRDVGPGNLAFTAYFNYSNAYTIPQSLLPIGVSSQYTHIGSYTPVDLALHYDFGDKSDGLFKGFSLTLSAQNVFNEQPPFVMNTSSSASIQFDPANASALGRVLTVQVAKKF